MKNAFRWILGLSLILKFAASFAAYPAAQPWVQVVGYHGHQCTKPGWGQPCYEFQSADEAGHFNIPATWCFVKVTPFYNYS